MMLPFPLWCLLFAFSNRHIVLAWLFHLFFQLKTKDATTFLFSFFDRVSRSNKSIHVMNLHQFCFHCFPPFSPYTFRPYFRLYWVNTIFKNSCHDKHFICWFQILAFFKTHFRYFLLCYYCVDYIGIKISAILGPHFVTVAHAFNSILIIVLKYHPCVINTFLILIICYWDFQIFLFLLI